MIILPLFLVRLALSFVAPAGAAVAPVGGAAAPLCSIVSYPTMKDDRSVYFVGLARPDTVVAGPGEVVVEDPAEPGHFGRAGSRPTHGQLVDVVRFGSDEGLRAETAPTVVVVPWDYDGSCRPLPWGRSFQFLEVGRRGFYRLRLRPHEQWVDGRPTFDAFFPEIQALPAGMRFSYRPATDPQESLDADEYLALFERIPSIQEIQEEGWVAVEPVMEWARSNPRELDLTPGPDGNLALQLTLYLGNGSVLRMTGQRLSREVVEGRIR